ncbi:TetR/AcrR family transcriptional regulator [Nocardioides limicola]|uniref:TetR/AcrR family transcriptional regulator n=1 Tax=Nocardioides limicola TaxID=2803368 RepID=UPI00193B92FC|nr:TetR family transcriptional regulator [Nocardioides sp. DJM-14]
MTQRLTRRQVDLLERLVALLAAEGFADFTVDDLAARLRCSKTTLYALAPTKQELVVEVVKQYFRAAVPVVEARVQEADDATGRVQGYLAGVADYLTPLSRRFMEDLSAFGPAAEVYRQHTVAAATRIRELIEAGVEGGEFRTVNASFVGEMVAVTMFEIQRGEAFSRLDMSDADAYAELASLMTHMLTRSR